MTTRGFTAATAAFALVVGLSAPGVLAQGKGDAAAGKVLYEKECAKCHGNTGAGDGPQGPKLKPPPSNWSAGGGGLKGMDDQKIFDSIHKGSCCRSATAV